VIKDPEIHRQVLSDVLDYVQVEEFGLCGLIRSPLLGPKGNIEFFLHLMYPRMEHKEKRSLIDQVIKGN
jgi:23S rRNA (cytidine1920-2'-O)/16S rRNA (cytidine1409-2'-O)-methyltransferase